LIAIILFGVIPSPRSLITAWFLFFLFALNTTAQTNKITGPKITSAELKQSAEK